MRNSGQTQQILLITPRRIDRLFNQSFAALRLKWSHSLSILRYLISVSAVIARFLKKMRKILKKFCAQVGRQPLKVFLMRLPWGSDNGSERI